MLGGDKKQGFKGVDRIGRDELPLGARGQKEGTREEMTRVPHDARARCDHGYQQVELRRDDTMESLEGSVSKSNVNHV